MGGTSKGNEVSLALESADSVSVCEMAALLVTLGYEPVGGSMALLTGDGVGGGGKRQWRFFKLNPLDPESDLAAVLTAGVDAEKQRGPAAWIALAFANARALRDAIRTGSGLTWSRRGPGFGLSVLHVAAVQRRVSEVSAELAAAIDDESVELVAAMAALGFNPLGERSAEAVTVSHRRLPGAVWYLPPVAANGTARVSECMALYQDSAWCARENNRHPIAAIADAFYNLRVLRHAQGLDVVRVVHRGRKVYVGRDASDATWAKAEKFLVG